MKKKCVSNITNFQFVFSLNFSWGFFPTFTYVTLSGKISSSEQIFKNLLLLLSIKIPSKCFLKVPKQNPQATVP